MNKILYSNIKKCLVYINQKADSHFWDSLWNTETLRKDIQSGKHDLFVAPITKKFLRPNSTCRILEGGCGKGTYVYSLAHQGYDAYGVDYAEETIKKILGAMPELNVRPGDVFSLPFADNYFDGYWSLGVIEHFWNGFDGIASEMARVVKKEGYVFLTFPYLSPLRKWNIKRKKYPMLSSPEQPENFYQFALDSDVVEAHFKQRGFTVVHKRPYDGLKGILDETTNPLLYSWLYKFYNTKNFLLRILKLVITVVLAPYSGHVMLLVLKKQ